MKCVKKYLPEDVVSHANNELTTIILTAIFWQYIFIGAKNHISWCTFDLLHYIALVAKAIKRIYFPLLYLKKFSSFLRKQDELSVLALKKRKKKFAHSQRSSVLRCHFPMRAINLSSVRKQVSPKLVSSLSNIKVVE